MKEGSREWWCLDCASKNGQEFTEVILKAGKSTGQETQGHVRTPHVRNLLMAKHGHLEISRTLILSFSFCREKAEVQTGSGHPDIKGRIIRSRTVIPKVHTLTCAAESRS